MAIRRFALVYGIALLVVGIAGFIPGLVMPLEPQHPDLVVEAAAGRLFGLFPVNVLHNLVHIIFGIWGIAVWRSVPRSLTYARSVAIIYAIFVIMGLIPLLRTTFGLVPLYGHDVWLHILLAAVAGYFGFVARADTGTTTTTGAPAGPR